MPNGSKKGAREKEGKKKDTAIHVGTYVVADGDAFARHVGVLNPPTEISAEIGAA